MEDLRKVREYGDEAPSPQEAQAICRAHIERLRVKLRRYEKLSKFLNNAQPLNGDVDELLWELLCKDND